MTNNAESLLGAFHSVEVCSGLGQHAQENTLKPLAIGSALAMVANPSSTAKEDALWITTSTAKTRKKADIEQAEHWLLWLDVDGGSHALDALSVRLHAILGGAEFHIYSTKGATAGNPKWRVLVPLAKPIPTPQWLSASQALFERAGGQDKGFDPVSTRHAQVCYLPNRGVYYEHHSNAGHALEPLSSPLAVTIGKIEAELAASHKEAQERRQKAEERRAALKLTGGTPADLIGAFNDAYPVEEILLQAGYKQRGNAFSHPDSRTGNYAATVRDGRVNTLSSADKLYSDGGAHDAFSAFCELFHDGNENAALRDAGDQWLSVNGESWNKAAQRAYMAANDEQAPANTDNGEPAPLFEARDYKPFPMHALPVLMQDAIKAVMQYAQAPDWLASQWVIGTLNEVAAPRINAPDPRGGKDGQPCSLFMLSLAGSGTGKSSCKTFSEGALAAFNKQASRDHQKALNHWRGALAAKSPKEQQDYLHASPDNLEPVSKCFRINGCTVEALAKRYMKRAPSVSYVTDEGGQFFSGYSMTSDQAAEHMGTLTQLFDSGTIERHRVTDEGGTFAYDRRLTMSLAAQESVVRKALDSDLMREQGLGARFCLHIGPFSYGSRQTSLESLSWNAEADSRLVAWNKAIGDKLAHQPMVNDEGELNLSAIALAGDAKLHWIRFANERERLQADGEEFSGLRAYNARTAQIALRLAANFAFINGSGMITLDEIKGACDLAAWYAHNWLVFYEADKPTGELANAQVLLDWLKEKDWREFDRSSLAQNGPRRLRRNSKERNHALAKLCENKWLTLEGKTFKANW